MQCDLYCRQLVCTAAADDSGIVCSSPKTAARQPARAVDDSAVQSQLSASFSRTVQDWERVRQNRSKSQSASAGVAAASTPPPKPSSSAEDRGKSRERDKSRQRAEKELSKLTKKEQKLEEELRRLVAARIKVALLFSRGRSQIPSR